MEPDQRTRPMSNRLAFSSPYCSFKSRSPPLIPIAILILTLIAQSVLTKELECYCQGHCPDNSHNGTCRTSSFCFASVEEVHDHINGDFDLEYTYGCLPPEETGYMQCMGHLVPHEIPRNISCCNDGDLCNSRLELPQLTRRTLPVRHDWFESIGEDANALIVIGLSLILCVILLGALASLALVNIRRRKTFTNSSSSSAAGETNSESEEGGSSPLIKEVVPANVRLNQLIDASMTSGSGSGLPHLVQKTIARDIVLREAIGKGRYGEVWLGDWRGESIAVKVFYVQEEASYVRERDVYERMFLRHDHILGYIASDIRGKDFTQLLLITDYHENGSLYDYLQIKILTVEEMFRLAHSAASGLCFLHTEINGKQIKPAIAHRDIKSKNVLVKRDGTCCIADFGLAVAYDSREHRLDIPENPARVGTKRYMAPEVLDETIRSDSMEAFKCADIYSLSLVLWEILTRVEVGDRRLVADYEIPYAEYGMHDPSFEEMKKIVVTDGARPEIPGHLADEPALERVVKLIYEAWAPNPVSRISALRIKKSLALLMAQQRANNKNQFTNHNNLNLNHNNRLQLQVNIPSPISE